MESLAWVNKGRRHNSLLKAAEGPLKAAEGDESHVCYQ